MEIRWAEIIDDKEEMKDAGKERWICYKVWCGEMERKMLQKGVGEEKDV